MCRQATCPRCKKTTWAGCGAHVEQVLRNVPQSQRCTCTPAERASTPKVGWFERRRAAKRGAR